MLSYQKFNEQQEIEEVNSRLAEIITHCQELNDNSGFPEKYSDTLKKYTQEIINKDLVNKSNNSYWAAQLCMKNGLGYKYQDEVHKSFDEELNENSIPSDKVSYNFNHTILGLSAIGDDWEGLYVNGQLIDEGHSLYWSHVIKKLIQKGLDLSQYKLIGLELYSKETGDYEDIAHEDADNNKDLLFYSCPKKISEFLDKVKEAGYTWKIT